MGFIKRQNKALKEIREERIQEYLKEINEVSKEHKLTLIPIIGKYGATFEVQESKVDAQKEENKKTPYLSR